MKDAYKDTSYFYNQIYENREEYVPSEVLFPEVVEKGLAWVSESADKVFDIGCGSGEMALKTLSLGVKKVMGLDISFHGISLARRTGSQYFNNLQMQWVWSGIEALRQFPDACCQGIILSNILETLRPCEGRLALEETFRLLDVHGKVLIVMPDFEALKLEEAARPILTEFDEVEDNAYELSSGLFQWRLKAEELEALMVDQFKLESKESFISESGEKQWVFRFIAKPLSEVNSNVQ